MTSIEGGRQVPEARQQNLGAAIADEDSRSERRCRSIADLERSIGGYKKAQKRPAMGEAFDVSPAQLSMRGTKLETMIPE